MMVDKCFKLVDTVYAIKKLFIELGICKHSKFYILLHSYLDIHFFLMIQLCQQNTINFLFAALDDLLNHIVISLNSTVIPISLLILCWKKNQCCKNKYLICLYCSIYHLCGSFLYV